jgi:predicted transcriptional regulator
MTKGSRAGHVPMTAVATTPITAIPRTALAMAAGVTVARRSRKSTHAARARARAAVREFVGAVEIIVGSLPVGSRSLLVLVAS